MWFVIFVVAHLWGLNWIWFEMGFWCYFYLILTCFEDAEINSALLSSFFKGTVYSPMIFSFSPHLSSKTQSDWLWAQHFLRYFCPLADSFQKQVHRSYLKLTRNDYAYVKVICYWCTFRIIFELLKWEWYRWWSGLLRWCWRPNSG